MPDTNDGDLTGRVAVVTGASAGIGAAVVRDLAGRGAAVAACARGPEGLEALAEELAGAPGSVHTYQADMAVEAEVSGFLDRVQADLGDADILINNVGQSPSRNFLYMSDEDWADGFQLNLMAAVRCTRRLLPAMRKQKWGRIVMVSTGAGKYPAAATVDYAAAKVAMVAMAKALARKYGADNVLVNSILPGLIRTPMWERAAEEIAAASDRQAEDVISAQSKKVPLGRFGQASEVADLVGFLCSERASYLTGVAIDIDGGLGTHIF